MPGPGDFEIEVLDADPRRVKRVRITRRKAAPERRERAARRAPTQRDPRRHRAAEPPPDKGSP